MIRVGDHQRDHMASPWIGITAATGIAEAGWAGAREVAFIPGDKDNRVAVPCSRVHNLTHGGVQKGIYRGQTRSLSILRPTTIARASLRASPLVCSSAVLKERGSLGPMLSTHRQKPSSPLPQTPQALARPPRPAAPLIPAQRDARAESQIGRALEEREQDRCQCLRACFHDGTRVLTSAAESARCASTDECSPHVGERVSPHLREMRDYFLTTRYLI